jgi:hypothetical protein
MYYNGVDISSQVTYYAEDEDNSFDDTQQSPRSAQGETRVAPIADADSCFDFSDEDDFDSE